MGLAEDHPRTHKMYTRSGPLCHPVSSVNAEATKLKGMTDQEDKDEGLNEMKQVATEKNVLSEKFAQDIVDVFPS
jgi:hypothetical protein